MLYRPVRLASSSSAGRSTTCRTTACTTSPTEDKLKTTRNRIGGERWISPVMLYQNYHLVHHLHPLVPFYRYIAVWRRNEAKYLEGDPALSTRAAAGRSPPTSTGRCGSWRAPLTP